jgi:hypothetical protein
MSNLNERTYQKLLAPLRKKPSIWAECLFANPVGDIAILGSADSQDLAEQAVAYNALVESAAPIPIDPNTAKRGWFNPNTEKEKSMAPVARWPLVPLRLH